MRYKRFLAVTVSVVLLSVTLLCVSFTAVSAGHRCCGEHCPVCMNIDRAASTVKQLSAGFGITVPVTAPVCSFTEYIYIVPESRHADNTPITLKTRKDE